MLIVCRRLENEASSRSVDSLLNYETVKYFNNEAYEVRGRTVPPWERVKLKLLVKSRAFTID